MKEILIRLTPNSKPQPIIPQAHFTGKYGYVVLGPVQIGSQAETLATMLRWLADQLEPQFSHNPADRVLTITPGEVVEYFEQSLVLREMAADVAAVLRPGGSAAPVSQLDQDLKAIAHLTNPSLADIAEILTGSRQYGGATYHRVKAVSQALKSSTTTEENLLHGLKSQKQAA